MHVWLSILSFLIFILDEAKEPEARGVTFSSSWYQWKRKASFKKVGWSVGVCLSIFLAASNIIKDNNIQPEVTKTIRKLCRLTDQEVSCSINFRVVNSRGAFFFFSKWVDDIIKKPGFLFCVFSLRSRGKKRSVSSLY